MNIKNMARWLAVQAAAIFCALSAVLVYSNTLQCGIVYDDEPAIKKNQDLRPHTPWSSLLWHDFWGAPMDSPTSHKSYRPLCVATFRLNYLLHELQPMGYHLVNVLLHSAVCYLYVQLCGVVFSAVWPALIAGLLFAVHPIHTEAVSKVYVNSSLFLPYTYWGKCYTVSPSHTYIDCRWSVCTLECCDSQLIMFLGCRSCGKGGRPFKHLFCRLLSKLPKSSNRTQRYGTAWFLPWL